jgi:hypothetical protein
MSEGEVTFYEHVEGGLSKKGRGKLANYVAHGAKIISVQEVVVLEREGDYLLLTVEGETYRATKCI